MHLPHSCLLALYVFDAFIRRVSDAKFWGTPAFQAHSLTLCHGRKVLLSPPQWFMPTVKERR